MQVRARARTLCWALLRVSAGAAAAAPLISAARRALHLSCDSGSIASVHGRVSSFLPAFARSRAFDGWCVSVAFAFSRLTVIDRDERGLFVRFVLCSRGCWDLDICYFFSIGDYEIADGKFLLVPEEESFVLPHYDCRRFFFLSIFTQLIKM